MKIIKSFLIACFFISTISLTGCLTFGGDETDTTTTSTDSGTTSTYDSGWGDNDRSWGW